MDFYGYLYCHTHRGSGKKYWGQTINRPSDRWGKNGRYYKGQVFGDAVLKEGWDSFQHDIIGVFPTKQQLDAAEIYWIKATQSTNPAFGYNVDPGGESTTNRKRIRDAWQRWNKKSIDEKRKILLQRAEQKLNKIVEKENKTNDHRMELGFKPKTFPQNKKEKNKLKRKIANLKHLIETGKSLYDVEYESIKAEMKEARTLIKRALFAKRKMLSSAS